MKGPITPVTLALCTVALAVLLLFGWMVLGAYAVDQPHCYANHTDHAYQVRWSLLRDCEFSYDGGTWVSADGLPADVLPRHRRATPSAGVSAPTAPAELRMTAKPTHRQRRVEAIAQF
jgi:hypothetical protein